jgi:hypothetical protein
MTTNFKSFVNESNLVNHAFRELSLAGMIQDTKTIDDCGKTWKSVDEKTMSIIENVTIQKLNESLNETY